MQPKSVFITGTNRGLGLGLARKFLERDWKVFAGARKPGESPGLKSLLPRYEGRLLLVPIDVASDESVTAALEAVAGNTDRLDCVVNNAGVYGGETGDIRELDFEEIRYALEVNTLGALRVTRAFFPLLAKGTDRKLVHITTLMGSIADNRSGGSYGYRISKAALNMVSKNLAIDLAPYGITSVVLHPGWVRTEMGGPNAPLDVETSAAGMTDVILSLGKERNGSFLNYRGEPLPY